MEITNDSGIKKPKRLTSVVWNHFERVKKGDICYAVCVHCNKKLSGSSNSGTTHLRNHLMRCLKRSNFDVSQLLTSKRRRRDYSSISLGNISFDEGQRKEEYMKSAIIKFEQDHKKDEIINFGSSKFDQERSQLDLARMIILHGYPLDMVEHVGFKVFVKNLQPLFDFVPNSGIEVSCIEIYGREKEKVSDMISKLHGRINLSIEMWSVPENSECLCLAAHYIDEAWKLQKKILNFVTLDSSYTEDELPEVIIKCLNEWNIDCKLFSLTLDDCSMGDEITVRIKERILEKRPFSGIRQLNDIRSAAHLLSSMAQDALNSLHEVIQKIRDSIKYVKSSQVIQGKFNEIAQHSEINSQKPLVLDCPVHWNSTFFMLETAVEYKAAFLLFQEHDPSYSSALSDEEWEWASSVTAYLKTFVEITNIFLSNRYPTANMFFPEICDVHIQLIEWCRSPNNFLSSTSLKMKARFDKYWSKCSLALAVAAILDPRFKMKLVEYYYSQIYGSTALDRIKEVSDGIKQLFHAYSICSTMVDHGSALPGSSNSPSTSNDMRDRLKGFDKFLHETSQSHSMTSDLDKYLEEPIFPRTSDFNILNWWKVHMPRYPILSMMARDILGTPMSTLAPEMAFNSGGRIVDPSRSLLSPATRQALICTQDWLQNESGDSNPSSSLSALPVLIESN